MICGNLESSYKKLLANVAVKISVFNNSNLIYTGLMFGGSLGLYAGLRFNEYSIVYNV